MTCTRLATFRLGVPLLTALFVGQGILASGVVAAPTHRPAPASMKALVLLIGDVNHVYGSGFRAFINGIITNKDLADSMKTVSSSTSTLSLATAGRVTGYESVWFRGGRTSYLSVSNVVTQYKSDSFPHAMLSHYAGHMTKHGVTYRFTPVPGLGDEGTEFTMQRKGVTAYGLVFRRGSYLGEIMVSALKGKISTAGLTQLATLEDHRIQAHG